MNLQGKLLLVFSVVSLLATACTGRDTLTTNIPATQTPGTAPTLTPAASPTLPPGPSATSMPVPTPEPGLRTDGPYLTYFSNTDEQRQLVLMDAEGNTHRRDFTQYMAARHRGVSFLNEL